jgi:hypothetical protein
MNFLRNKKRLLPALLSLAVVGSVAGCENERSILVESYPQLGPFIGGRPKPSPFKLATGNVRGVVHGRDGIGQPIGLAFVTTGSVSTTASNPQQDQAINADEEKDDGKEKIYVMHDFGDGTPVLTERRKRLKPGGPEPFDKYVYLRPGEFFLEDVPDGIATVTASYGGVSSQQTQVEVYAGNTRADIKIPLYIPGPVQVENSNQTPKVVDFIEIDPSTGVAASVTIKEDTENNTREITVEYKPDPPDVTVTLKAPPGSAGTVIRSINLIYSYDTFSGRHEETPAINLPISPHIVGPAQDTAYGPPTTIRIPVGSSVITQIFDKEADDPPGLIICTMEFIDEQGFAVLDKNFQNLEVATVLRRL